MCHSFLCTVVLCVSFQTYFLFTMLLLLCRCLWLPTLVSLMVLSIVSRIYHPRHGLFMTLMVSWLIFKVFFLGCTTNNIYEYSAVTKLLSEAIYLDIRELVVNLDSQLVVLQLNRQYSIRNPQILIMYIRIHLLERNFDYITYHHIPR